MTRKLPPVIFLGASIFWFASPALAQDPCAYWFGDSSCRIDGRSITSSPLLQARDFLPPRSPILPWKPSIDKDAALGLQFLQKPRLVLWVQPIQKVWGFHLFFDF
jgi:hypothetical protein